MRSRHRLSGMIAFALEPNWFSLMICKDLSSRKLFRLHNFQISDDVPIQWCQNGRLEIYDLAIFIHKLTEIEHQKVCRDLGFIQFLHPSLEFHLILGRNNVLRALGIDRAEFLIKCMLSACEAFHHALALVDCLGDALCRFGMQVDHAERVESWLHVFQGDVFHCNFLKS